ncbi:MAG: hypothetical protein QW265_00565 [Candidatus Bathyarchaeia archaeon]
MLIGYRKPFNDSRKAVDDLLLHKEGLKGSSNALAEEPDQFLSSIIKSLEEASIKIQNLEEIIKTLLNNRLSKKQLRLLSGVKNKEGLLYYRLIQILSREFSMPTSTVKWNLNRLRELDTIVTGNKNNKGVPVRVTLKGKMLLKIFNKKLHVT